jgi:hypothetical protein
MRKFILLAALCPAFILTKGQSTATNPFPKTISVSGSAEMEIVPDEIYVNIILREYQKRGQDKKELEAIKADFMAAVKAAALPDSIISIVSYTGYNNYYWMHKKKKDPDMNASITYQVKFSNSKQMDDLVDKLDDEATQSFNIVSTSHSKMTEFRKQLKIEAVKAAKNKALYLTEAINEKLGSAISVKEPAEQGTNRIINYSNAISQTRLSNSNYSTSIDNGTGLDIDFKKLKMRYEVDVLFAIQ